MIISSRTPEGDHHRCPLCGQDTRTDPSTVPIRDAPCPHCGHLLLFRVPGTWGGRSLLRPRSYEGSIMAVGKERLGPFPLELQPPLLAVIGLLARQGRLPDRTELIRLAETAQCWAAVVRQLEMLAQPGRLNRWAYAMGAFLRRTFKHLRAMMPT
jgi:hypothetical protein